MGRTFDHVAETMSQKKKKSRSAINNERERERIIKERGESDKEEQSLDISEPANFHSPVCDRAMINPPHGKPDQI